MTAKARSLRQGLEAVRSASGAYKGAQTALEAAQSLSEGCTEAFDGLRQAEAHRRSLSQAVADFQRLATAAEEARACRVQAAHDQKEAEHALSAWLQQLGACPTCGQATCQQEFEDKHAAQTPRSTKS